jgi:hypothetical protein
MLVFDNAAKTKMLPQSVKLLNRIGSCGSRRTFNTVSDIVAILLAAQNILQIDL